MERRRERRGLLDQSVQVTLLRGAEGTEDVAAVPDQDSKQHQDPHRDPSRKDLRHKEKIQFTAQTIDQSGKGMRLLTPIELHLGTTLKIETDDTLILAEVCHCNRVNESRFAVGLQVSQSLTFTDQLRRLSRAVAASASGGTARTETDQLPMRQGRR